MTRFTFGAFELGEENREACELCRAVAELLAVKPQPVILVGESGSGKTHLLCAIINRVREHAPRTALAYLTAKDVPEAARALVDDASPVTRARAAVLLVDQFEKFPADGLETLERITPLFMEENRYVVIATQTHPEQMKNLPPGLTNLIRFGRTVYVQRTKAARVSENLETELPEFKAENQSLHQEIERLSEQILKLEAEREDSGAAPPEMEDLIEEKGILTQEVRSLQRALDETRKQRDACQADAAALAAANAELKRLRKQLDAAAPVPDRPAAERIRALEEEAAKSNEAAQLAHAELERWTLRAQAMIQQLELNRARFAQTEEAYRQTVIELRQRLAQYFTDGTESQSNE